MTTTREIRRRISTVDNIGKVTRAMEAVSAAKMRRASAAALARRAYARKAAEIMACMRAERQAHSLHPLLADHQEGRPVLILITPDRGLTGGLVLGVLEVARSRAAEMAGEVAWMAVGRKGRRNLERQRAARVVLTAEVSDPPGEGQIDFLVTEVRDGFLERRFRSVDLVYATFRSAMRQEVVVERLLPIELPPAPCHTPAAYTFEPSPEVVLAEMLPRLIELRMYEALLESQASEHAARMVAMGNACRRTEDLVDELSLAYNVARQADITSELLDIAGGAEALRQSEER